MKILHQLYLLLLFARTIAQREKVLHCYPSAHGKEWDSLCYFKEWKSTYISKKFVSRQSLMSEAGLCFVISSDHLDEHLRGVLQSRAIKQLRSADFRKQILARQT